jgi:hypothetical protein
MEKIFFSGNIRHLPFSSDLAKNQTLINDMRRKINAGDILILNNFIDPKVLYEIKNYLIGIGRGSLPNYTPIFSGAPNNHRINKDDERSYVRGCFHQFSFYPWNQDIFDLFAVFRPVFELKNILGGLPQDSFLFPGPENGCAARLSFQFYPAGQGFLNKHIDPIDYHQKIVPTMLLSEKGKDFYTGGAYVEDADGKIHYLDDLMSFGDLTFFNAQIVHGVEKIDPPSQESWLSFQGRWMLLFAINKLAENNQISPSIDLSSLNI